MKDKTNSMEKKLFSIIKTDRHDITEILMKLALNIIIRPTSFSNSLASISLISNK
jgi:hypothetical protein